MAILWLGRTNVAGRFRRLPGYCDGSDLHRSLSVIDADVGFHVRRRLAG